MTDEPLLYNAEQAAKRLGGAVYPSWLRKKAAAELIPHTIVGRKRLFSEQDLADIIASRRFVPRAARRAVAR